MPAAARPRHDTNVGHTAVSNATSAVADSDVGSDAVDAARATWYDQRKAYRRLRHQKCRDFWTETVESETAHPARLWRTWISYLVVVALLWLRPLTRGDRQQVLLLTRSPRYVHLYTDNAPPPTYTHAPPGPSLREFSTISADDIISGARQLPDKKFSYYLRRSKCLKSLRLYPSCV